MQINSNYIVVEKLEQEQQEGFKTVEVQDNFIYKGKVIQAPQQTAFVDNHELTEGDIVMFAKYSPDIHEMDMEGKKVKFIKITDILAVL